MNNEPNDPLLLDHEADGIRNWTTTCRAGGSGCFT